MENFYKVYTKGDRYEPPIKRWLLVAEFRYIEDAESWICTERSGTSPEDDDSIDHKIMCNGRDIESKVTK